MPVDFEKLGQSRKTSELVSPRDIFNALPDKQPGYGYLRDPQGHVLDEWEKRRTESDLSIKMNTGTGKTIVGLLMLQSSLNEGVGPALYVAPTSYLAQQVRVQAQHLGIRTATNPDATEYFSHQQIAVVNIHKLMNGRSVFGGPGNPRSTPVPIGAVVIDDAHAALAETEEQSTLTLPRDHPASEFLLDLFEADLRAQSEGAWLDVKSGLPSALVRVPMWAWSNHRDAVARVLHEHAGEDEIDFKLPFLVDSLGISSAIFTGAALEIRLPCPPVQLITSLREAKRRVFLTATLADDSVLVRDFDANPKSVADAITPVTAADIGDRLILIPREVNPQLSDDDIRTMLARFATRYNVVVLVPSFRRAEDWADVASATAAASDIAEVVERLQDGHVGLVVLVSKYDGVDLPDDSCRILVIDGVPDVYSATERRDASILGDSNRMFGRQLQRVEQGMGRGVRSADDYCVVLIVGDRLTQLLVQPDNVKRLGTATKAQLELSRLVAQEIAGGSVTDISSLIEQVLGRDHGWVEASRGALAGIPYSEGETPRFAISGRSAFNAAFAGQFQRAASVMSEAVSSASEPKLAGWLQEQLAVYQQQLNGAAAQRTLVGAIQKNPRVTRPLEGVSYRRLTSVAEQGQVAAEYLVRHYTEESPPLLGINGILDRLRFQVSDASEFEDAVDELGWHLGFPSQRPDRDTGRGPDVLWALGDLHYLIIECKSEVTVDRIWRRDVEQLSHSLNWFGEEYDHSCTATPLLFHPVRTLDRRAVAPPGCRIVTEEKLGELAEEVRRYGVALGSSAEWRDPAFVQELLHHHELTRGLASRFSRSPRVSN